MDSRQYGSFESACSEFAKSFIGSLYDEYLAQQDGASKIKFCLKQMKQFYSTKRLPTASEAFQPKSDAISVDARTKGNEFFRIQDYVSALDWYNRSICFAPTNSENLGMGYANRSAVFLNSGFYKFCLQNIELALANNYPEKLKGKLENRKKECLEKMKTREDSLVKFDKDFTPLPLSYPANKRIPMMIEGLEYAKSEHKFRTKRDLKPGDILIVDNSFSKDVEKNWEYKLCTNCWESNYLNLLPCNTCTKVMFCSESCILKATNRFHKYECKIKDENIFQNPESPIRIALRVTLQSFTMFDDLQDLQKLIKNIKEKNDVLEDVDYVNFTEQQQFRAVYALNFNKNRDSFEILEFAKECAIAWHLLIQYTDLRVLLRTKNMEELFLNLLFHFYQVSKDSGSMCGNQTSHHTFDNYGTALFSVIPFFKHSCIPNATNLSVKGKITTVAIRSIKAGEEIFINFLIEAHHCHKELQHRKDVLKSRYNYDCNCKACLFDYPTFMEMKPRDWDFLEISLEEHEVIKKTFNKQFSKKMMNKYINLIIKYEKGIPNVEVYQSETVFITAIWHLINGRPLNMQLKPI